MKAMLDLNQEFSQKLKSKLKSEYPLLSIFIGPLSEESSIQYKSFLLIEESIDPISVENSFAYLKYLLVRIQRESLIPEVMLLDVRRIKTKPENKVEFELHVTVEVSHVDNLRDEQLYLYKERLRLLEQFVLAHHVKDEKTLFCELPGQESVRLLESIKRLY